MSSPKFIGFKCWNDFEAEIRLLQQLYDFSVHLYSREHDSLASQRFTPKAGTSIHTSVGTITHNINRLFVQTSTNYPYKLRELILVSAVTSLEVFLSDLILEISRRTLAPFLTQTPIELIKAQALSYPSIESLQEDIVGREIRQLTSGGLTEFEKFYRSRFGIDFKALGSGYYEKILEIHDRRHLYVHRNGICDEHYSSKYPSFGYDLGKRIYSDHEYLINVFNTLKGFGAQIKIAALAKYPTDERRRRSAIGNRLAPRFEQQPLLIRIELQKKDYDGIGEIPNIAVQVGKSRTPHILGEFVYHMIQEENLFLLILAGTDEEVKAIMHALRHQEELIIRSVSGLFA